MWEGVRYWKGEVSFRVGRGEGENGYLLMMDFYCGARWGLCVVLGETGMVGVEGC